MTNSIEEQKADDGCMWSYDASFWETITVADVHRYLDSGAGVNDRDSLGLMPLHWAARWSSKEVIAALLEANADIHAPTTWLGQTPLHLAATRSANMSAAEAVKVLLGADAPVHAKDNNVATAVQGSPEVVKALIDGGANVNAKDEAGNTPLHVAVMWNAPPEQIKMFLDAGANLEETNHQGQTPLDIARETDDVEVARMLADALDSIAREAADRAKDPAPLGRAGRSDR